MQPRPGAGSLGNGPATRSLARLVRARSEAAAAGAGGEAREAREAIEGDAALVARCVAGDGGAWATLVQRYQRLVYTIAQRVGLDEHLAADVFQTVFSRLIEHLPRLADPSRLQAWIVTTTKREALLQRRLAQRHVSMTRADDDDADQAAEWDVPDESPIAEEALAELQQLHRLRNALEQLDERCRTLLGLLFRDTDEPLSYDDVARRLATSVGSIGPTRSRCLDKLRRLVDEGHVFPRRLAPL